MQNMERYFGFKVFVSDDLDPEDEKILRTKAKELIDIDGLDLDKYQVYLHQLIIQADAEHFGLRSTLGERVESINLDFYVNEKQRQSGEIRFMNYVVQTRVPEAIKPRFSPGWIGYKIPSEFFSRNDWFQNAIVVFIRKDIRTKHRKIKVVVTATPTKNFTELLRSRRSVDAATHLDLRFRKSIQLRLPFDGAPATRPNTTAEQRNAPASLYFINHGNVGAFGNAPIAYEFTNNQSLLKDLQRLHADAVESEEVGEAEKIEAAILSIKDKKNMKAIEYLKSLGEWSLERIEVQGMTAAIEALKGATA